MKKILAMVLALTMMAGLLPLTIAMADEAPIVVRFGTHWTDGDDPFKISETTGTYTMTNEEDRLLRVAAWEKVKEELNVEIQFVQYAQDTRQELVLSVLARNPVCDIAMMWSGSEATVLSQNILQPLDQFADVFEGAEWMMADPLYGHTYFLNSNAAPIEYFPILVNLTMIEKVETLREEDGTILYPTELLERGEWTWENFKDYLTKIQAYYANTPAPDGAKVDHVMAYETDHRYSVLAAALSNGGGIYAGGDLSVNSQETIDAVAYIRSLFDLGVAADCGLYDDGFTPQWCESGYDFGRGAAVFAECPNWVIPSQVQARTDAGESVALMPFPRPDRLAEDDPSYQQYVLAGDLLGVLKGIDEDQARTALQAFRLYWETYYKLKAGVDNMAEYVAANAESQAIAYGLDIMHPEVGDGVLNAFTYNANKCSINEFGQLMGMWGAWESVLGKGWYGIDGMASFETAIVANLTEFSKVVEATATILGTEDIYDNQGPNVTASGFVAIPVGTDIATVDFTQYFSAEDGFDGVLDPADATYKTDSVDTATVGSYKVKGIFADKAGNEGSADLTVIVYNADNTAEPTLIVKAELPKVAMESDASAINWKDYVETATDADGLDLKDKITADISELDTYMTGDYPVTLTVTDYAGNTASVEITVSVVYAE